jgi:hypothetical protein
MTGGDVREQRSRRKSDWIRLYFTIVGVIVVVVAGGLFLTRPKAGELKRAVEEAMAAYEQAKDAAPAARSYSAERDGKSFSCWGVSIVTVCDSPDH